MARKPTFHESIRAARLKRRLTREQLAEQTGVSGVCIYFWEIGRTKPRDNNLVALCKVLKMPIRATRELLAA